MKNDETWTRTTIQRFALLFSRESCDEKCIRRAEQERKTTRAPGRHISSFYGDDDDDEVGENVRWMRRVMGSDIDVVVVARARRRVAAIAVMPRGEERSAIIALLFW